MSDPFSVASGAAGIVSLGLTLTNGLIEYYNKYSEFDTDASNTEKSLDVLHGKFEGLSEA